MMELQMKMKLKLQMHGHGHGDGHGGGEKQKTIVLAYPRSELRKRIFVYKNDLGYSGQEIQDMVRRDPRMLQTNSHKVKKMLEVLEEELNVGPGDIRKMLKKEILLLTYDAEKNIRPTIRYLTNGPVGKCLGMVERKGKSTLCEGATVEENEALIRSRVKALVVEHPKLLSFSLERNLKPTVAFFWGGARGGEEKEKEEIGRVSVLPSVLNLTDYEFGKVLYRRGGSLLEANVERTLSKKVEFLKQALDLDDTGSDDHDHPEGNQFRGKDCHDVGEDGIMITRKVTIPLPRRFLSLQDSNNAGDHDGDAMDNDDHDDRAIPNQFLTSFDQRRLLAQMIATAPDILTLSIDTNLKPKFDYFLNTMKFEKDELRYIVLKRPQLLSLNLDRNIVPKIDFLLKDRKAIGSLLHDPASYEGGLGMSMKEVKDWLVMYPQILMLGLDKRIRPRVYDIVRYNLTVGSGEGNVPMNCISRSEQSWKQWIKSNVA